MFRVWTLNPTIIGSISPDCQNSALFVVSMIFVFGKDSQIKIFKPIILLELVEISSLNYIRHNPTLWDATLYKMPQKFYYLNDSQYHDNWLVYFFLAISIKTVFVFFISFKKKRTVRSFEIFHTCFRTSVSDICAMRQAIVNLNVFFFFFTLSSVVKRYCQLLLNLQKLSTSLCQNRATDGANIQSKNLFCDSFREIIHFDFTSPC